jgi:hypothetical protein
MGAKTERNLLKHQFDALVHNETVGAGTTEMIFDAEFHRRFAELINRVADRQSRTGTLRRSRAMRAISGGLKR